MRNYIFKSILLIMLSLFCNTTSAIGLTEFTKQLIDLYIRTNQIPNNGDMVVHTKTDTLYYRVFLYSVDPDIPLSGDEYIGKVKHNERYVFLFGQQSDIFHIGKEVVKSELKAPERFDDFEIIFDPIVWDVWLKNNLKVIEPLTNGMDSVTYYQIEQMANTYLPDWTDKYPDKPFNWSDYTTPTEYEYIQMAKLLAKGQMPNEELNDSTIYLLTSEMPEFQGGHQALLKYIEENFRCMDSISESKGIIICEFVVEVDGSLSNVEIVRSSENHLLDAEAIRIIKQMPNWIPGKHQGKPVRVKYRIPIKLNCDANK